MAKLSTEKRKQLADSDFGIPEKRMYPLHDKAHVESAVKLFGHANPRDRKALAKRILARAKEFNMDTSGWETVLHYAQEQVPPMSDGTSLGNTPPKTDLSNNRGPIIAQEQTLYGIGAYTGDEAHKIPVECPNNMTDDENLLYQIIFDNHGDFDIINTIIEKIVAPLCDKLGLKENAMAVLMKYRHVDNEEDLWEAAFEHSDYVWGYLYPAARGMIKSDHIAHITFDTDCSYIENPERKRPVGYKQIVVEVELTTNGVIKAHVISPTKTESQKLLSFDIEEYRDFVNMRVSRDTFEKTCMNKIETILPSDLKKFIKNNSKSSDDYYSYPAKYFDALGMFDSIEDISRIYIRDEFGYDHRVKKLNYNDWQKKIEILDDVLKDTVIPIGFSDDIGDLFIQYKTSTGEIVESRHGQVLAKSWKEFESKLKKTDLRDQPVQEAAVGATLLNVKNQLMKMLGNAFQFIGGSMVPKFTMQSTEKPDVAFDVTTSGTNVEVTPKYNGQPDILHKRKGIALMSAANTIADFVKNIVSNYKPAMATESVYEDELFTRVRLMNGESIHKEV